jgi:nicotinamidase/pyrazinamidase
MEVATAVTKHLRQHRGDYELVVASRDWHDGDNDNGGHFPLAPAGSPSRWTTHCVAGTPGADYSSAFDDSLADIHVKKGQGRPDYSLFRGMTSGGEPFPAALARVDIDSVDICGLATEYCVRAAAIDALGLGYAVTVLSSLSAGYSSRAEQATYSELEALGVRISR